MAVLAYSLGKRIINQHFTIKNAKLISLALVISLLVFHTASRYYGGGDSCEWLLSRGRYLGENVWQPYGCIMHKYKSNKIHQNNIVFSNITILLHFVWWAKNQLSVQLICDNFTKN
uniref:Cas1p 10 TM acyl transferase domain-containing protein n=1 Tax=Monopterus albus TaxID=43700 RepID=A0A3Q3KHL7_MONAL